MFAPLDTIQFILCTGFVRLHWLYSLIQASI